MSCIERSRYITKQGCLMHIYFLNNWSNFKWRYTMFYLLVLKKILLSCERLQSCNTLQRRSLFINAVFGYKRQSCDNCIVIIYIVYAFKYDTCNQNLFSVKLVSSIESTRGKQSWQICLCSKLTIFALSQSSGEQGFAANEQNPCN